MKIIKEAGYHNYSMSNNAIQAYEEGERPLSKWTKSAVISEIARQLDLPTKDITLLKDWRDYLVKTSWHHTSKYYNKTDFYSVVFEDDDVLISKEAQQARDTERDLRQKAWIEELNDKLERLRSINIEKDFIKKEPPLGDTYYLYPTIKKTFSLNYAGGDERVLFKNVEKALQKEIEETQALLNKVSQ